MKTLTVILLSIISFSAAAQKGMHDKSDFMPTMTRGIGVSFVSFDGLNDRIAGFPQYKGLKDHLWTLSAGSMHNKKDFISGFTISAGSSLSGNRNKQSSALRSLNAGFDLGYDVIPSEKIMLYPLVGIGGEFYRAVFYKDNSAVDFNVVANSPTAQNSIRSVKFNNAFFAYRLGLGVALKDPKSKATIGLQAGYVGSFHDEAWKSSESQTLANAPADNLSRFNISLVVSGGMGMMGGKK